MAILKLKPSCKDYLWGGTRLKTEFGKEYDKEPLAESWELSCHPDGPSYIVNGEFAGKTLQEYIDANGKTEVTGTHCKDFEMFPVLIKFIDARKDLSIQVHPDDSFALENEGQYGKTEMWYVVDAQEGASLFYGFSREVSEKEFKERIRNHTLPEVLNKVMIHKGDVLFIDPGTIHAIGAGSLIAEIQQNSNVTYRVYDYGRKGPDGKERQLHVDKALKVTSRRPAAKDRDFGCHVASCKYFTVDKIVLDGFRRKKISGEADETSFVSVLVLNGSGKVSCNGETVEVKKGDSIFITAGSGEYELEGTFEALMTTV
ncbi:MAG: class I mannose-6-phosphate isomerase [Clostridia bacterium]|nr:class I mannose-6-phosphate isomerase [Clostridia bacterium]MDY5554462.1 type I phosphomannose isomerase catalytic subunit [Blautia sp.]